MSLDRAYHHGNLRAALLDAALEETRSGGALGLGLRPLTRQIGVSPNAAYRHFADRDALLQAVSHVIQDRMAQRMQRHIRESSSDGDPVRRAKSRLRGVGLGYVEFARAEPGWFELAFFGRGSAGPAPEERVPPPFALLVGALDELVAVGALPPAEHESALWTCWSAVHGFAELALRGPLRHQEPRHVSAMAVRVVDTAVESVASG